MARNNSAGRRAERAEAAASRQSSAPVLVDEQPVARDTRELDWHIQPTQPPAPWHDWADLMERAEGVHSVSMEWDAAIGAVEMLRDALAEHEHREGMVARIAVVLVERLPRDEAYEAARQILDTIEAA